MCTGIKINYVGGCIMGRTMDFEKPLNYNACYLPRAYNFADDLKENKLYSNYKILGLCFEDRIPIKDGINEHGLVGITNEFLGFNLYDNKLNLGKVNISSLDYLTYALGKYKSVEELVEDLENIHISTKNHRGESVLSPDFHFMFTDSTQRCVVIEPKGKELISYENPYDVITNSPGLESHIRRLNKLIDLNKLDEFNSSKNLPGGYDPFSRFIKAFYLSKMSVESKNAKEALSHFYNIMGAMVLPKGFIKNRKYNEVTYTRYICGYDTKDRKLTVKSYENPTVFHLDFEDIEDENSRQSFFLDLNFQTKKLKS